MLVLQKRNKSPPTHLKSPFSSPVEPPVQNWELHTLWEPQWSSLACDRLPDGTFSSIVSVLLQPSPGLQPLSLKTFGQSETHISRFKNGLNSLCLPLISQSPCFGLASGEPRTTMSGCNYYNNFNSLQKWKVSWKHWWVNEQCLCIASQGAGPVQMFHCPCAEQDCCFPSYQVNHFFLWIT